MKQQIRNLFLAVYFNMIVFRLFQIKKWLCINHKKPPSNSKLLFHEASDEKTVSSDKIDFLISWLCYLWLFHFSANPLIECVIASLTPYTFEVGASHMKTLSILKLTNAKTRMSGNKLAGFVFKCSVLKLGKLSRFIVFYIMN